MATAWANQYRLRRSRREGNPNPLQFPPRRTNSIRPVWDSNGSGKPITNPRGRPSKSGQAGFAYMRGRCGILILLSHLIFSARNSAAREFKVVTSVDIEGTHFGDIAGLAILGSPHWALIGVRKAVDCGRNEIIYLLKGSIISLGTLEEGTAHLRVQVSAEGLCTFAFMSSGNTFTDAVPEMQALAGGWIGAKVGLLCISASDTNSSGYADFEYFRFRWSIIGSRDPSIHSSRPSWVRIDWSGCGDAIAAISEP